MVRLTYANTQESIVLLKRFAEYLKTSPTASSFKAVVSSDIGEDTSSPVVEPAVLAQAEIVEGDGMETRPVGSPNGTRFTHFLDGIQTAQRIGFYGNTVPVVYGFIAAAVRRRDDKRMSTHDKELNENLYFSFNHMDSTELQSSGLQIKNATEKPGGDTDKQDVHPLRLLEIARQAVSNDRAEIEKNLALRWIENLKLDDWLLWDGSITGRVETSKHPRIVGAIKSHRTQYFPMEEQRKILSLKAGERSSVFQPRGRDWSPVYSWYLRMHPNEGRDIYFGLVRIEAAARPETISMADEISRWLLAERSPLSLPDSRWDRMIYPIRDCEQYLRSIAPSRIMIEAALAGI